ncbi:hypothetical protein HDU67_000908 [Dinochytrium kinnereticum]|nr:hypothetical protein HDU67_000908 [Dinochytrium kinnereticum]
MLKKDNLTKPTQNRKTPPSTSGAPSNVSKSSTSNRPISGGSMKSSRDAKAKRPLMGGAYKKRRDSLNDDMATEISLWTEVGTAKRLYSQCYEGGTKVAGDSYDLGASESGTASPDEFNPWEVFEWAEAKLAIDFVLSTFYQHYRLYQVAAATNQEKIEVLVLSITLEAYEEERARLQEIEQREREEFERREAERAAGNKI